MRKSHCQILFAVLILLAGVPAAATDVRLFVPEKIYAVPGVEMNVYFNNIVTVINPANCDDNSIRRWRQERSYMIGSSLNFRMVPFEAGKLQFNGTPSFGAASKPFSGGLFR